LDGEVEASQDKFEVITGCFLGDGIMGRAEKGAFGAIHDQRELIQIIDYNEAAPIRGALGAINELPGLRGFQLERHLFERNMFIISG